MKEKFIISIESFHIADKGQQPNVSTPAMELLTVVFFLLSTYMLTPLNIYIQNKNKSRTI